MLRVITEPPPTAPVPLWRQPDWQLRFPWLVQGTTGLGVTEEPFDIGVFGEAPVGKMMERWRALVRETGMRSAVHARQVHGTAAGDWTAPLPAGLFLTDSLDAHVTDQTGLLLAVSIADCVPIFIVSEAPRVVAIVHAGWRGVAAGALEATVDLLSGRGIEPGRLWLHCGPAICGDCYEVGPEVHAAIHPQREPPRAPRPIDLRRALLERAARLGLPDEQISVSAHCTLCGPGAFFSHRGGSSGRQMGVIGIRD